MKPLLYPASITKDEGGYYLVTFPDVPEAGTDDLDRDVAVRNALDSLACALEGYIDAGKPIPPPSAYQGNQVEIALPPLMAAKITLYTALREAKWSNVELAKHLNADEKAVRRLLDLRHRSHIDQIEKALEILGWQLVVGRAKAA